MSSSSLPDEFLRLQALARYAVLDTMPEEAFDRLTRLAARLFGVPYALVTLVDEERQWFKSCFGINLAGTPRSLSFCTHAIEQDGVMVVPDARQDARFADNLLVTGAPHIRFYAGAPLITPDGYKLGTLCILSDQPRPELTPEERATLNDLAALVMDELEWRLDRLRLETESQANARMLSGLRRVTQDSDLLLALTDLAEYNLSPHEHVRTLGELLHQELEVGWMQLDARTLPPGLTWAVPDIAPEFLQRIGELRLAPAGHGREEARFLDRLEGYPGLSPAFAALGVSNAAWLPFTTTNGRPHALTFARFGPPGPWRHSEKRLLQAAARTLQFALSRQEHLECLGSLSASGPLPGFRDRHALKQDLKTHLNAPGLLTGPLLLAKLEVAAFATVPEAGPGRAGAEAGAGDTWPMKLFGEALRARPDTGVQSYWLGEGRFALLLPGEPDASPEDLARRVLEDVNRAAAVVRAAGHEAAGVKVGVSFWPQEARSSGELLALARARLSQAYQSGEAPEQVGDPPRPVELSGPLSCGPLMLHPEQRRIRVDEQSLSLSGQETALLAALMRSPGEVFSRTRLAQVAWNKVPSGSNLVNVQVSRLRGKLSRLTKTVSIQTVRGEGYALHLNELRDGQGT